MPEREEGRRRGKEGKKGERKWRRGGGEKGHNSDTLGRVKHSSP